MPTLLSLEHRIKLNRLHALPGNEGSVKQIAAQQFDSDTALIESILANAEADFVAQTGNNEYSVKEIAAQQFDSDTALIESIRAEAGANWDNQPGNNQDSVLNAARVDHFEDAYESAAQFFFAQDGNTRADVLQATIDRIGDIRTTAPKALYERLKSEIDNVEQAIGANINALEQSIDTNVAAEIDNLSDQIDTKIGALEQSIDTNVTEKIVTAETNLSDQIDDVDTNSLTKFQR